MDLSFLRFEHDASVATISGDLAVLMVGVAARQATSPTAVLAGRLGAQQSVPGPFGLGTACFNAVMAETLRVWKEA